MADKKQAKAIDAAQLEALFGETIESADQITKENKADSETPAEDKAAGEEKE